MKKCAVNRERAVVTHNQVAEAAEPGEGALDFPAPSVAPPLVRLGSPAHVQQDIYATRQRPRAFRYCTGWDSRGRQNLRSPRHVRTLRTAHEETGAWLAALDGPV